MKVLLAALLATSAVFLGIVLRYAPFASEVSGKRKRLLFSIYGAVLGINLLLCCSVLKLFGISAVSSYIHASGTACAAITAFVNIALIPKRNREHLFVLGVMLLFFAFLLTIPTFISSLLPQITGDYAVFLRLFIYVGLLLLLFPLLHKLLRQTVEPFLQVESDGYWNTVCFIPIAYFGAVILFVFAADNVNPTFQMVSSMLSGTMIYLLCLSIIRDHKRIKRQKTMERQLETQKLHYAELQVRVQEARRTRHDYKHHLSAIRHFMDMDDKAGLYTYCDELLGKIVDQVPVPYTGNAAADGVLFYYMQKARREQIDFSHTGSIRSTGISDTDLCALLGNALDNACEGCKTLSQNRSIKLITQPEAHLLTVVVHNTFDGTVHAKGKQILSRKRENRTGVGIPSMRTICESYGGRLEYKWDEHTFTLMLMLPLQEEK